MNKIRKITLFICVVLCSTTTFAQELKTATTYYTKNEVIKKSISVRMGWCHDISIGFHSWTRQSPLIHNNISPALSYILSYRVNNPFEIGVGVIGHTMRIKDELHSNNTHKRFYGNLFANIRLYVGAENRCNPIFNIGIGLQYSHYDTKNITNSLNTTIFQSVKNCVNFYGSLSWGFNYRFNTNVSFNGNLGINLYKIPSIDMNSGYINQENQYSYTMQFITIYPYIRLGVHF